jgi:hypothetical protein
MGMEMIVILGVANIGPLITSSNLMEKMIITINIGVQAKTRSLMS